MIDTKEKYVEKLKTQIKDTQYKILIAEAINHAFPEPNYVEVTLSSNFDFKIKMAFPIGEEILSKHFNEFEEHLQESKMYAEDQQIIKDFSFMTNTYKKPVEINKEQKITELLLEFWI